MKTKAWLISWLVIVVSTLSVLGYGVYKIDPFFHYHKPELDSYYYLLNNERSQNDGISKHFDYDALISGTSMTENFRTTEADELFGCSFIKVPYSGGSYKEINDNIGRALASNPELKIIIRGLDMSNFFARADAMRTDLGKYPTYLYDDNFFNDVQYILNRDIVFGKVYRMVIDRDKEEFTPGITSFDDYSRWQASYTFGINSVMPDGIQADKSAEDKHLSEAEKAVIRENIEKNVTNVADEYPDVDFYYFYSPYSSAWWCDQYNTGSLYRQLEAERFITELILPHKNIHLYSFNNRTDITTDLNNYKDWSHYAAWINSLMLKWMHDGKYRLTEENYNDYLRQEFDFYTTFDYASMNGQADYEADYYAAALLNEELTGAKPLDVLNDDTVGVEITGAEYIIEDGRNAKVNCRGTLARDYGAEPSAEYIGVKFTVNLDKGYNYLCFDGQKVADCGSLTAYVYNESGRVVGKAEAACQDLDNELHQYAIDLSTVKGNVTVVLNGGCPDHTGSVDSNCQFSNIFMY